MTEARSSAGAMRVLIAGGGVAALEGALALRELAADRVSVALLAPEPEFVYRPLSVREPFSYRAAERHSIAAIAEDLGAELIVDSFASIEPERRIVHTEAGAELSYDAALLAIGAHAHARFPHAITIDDAHIDELMHGLIEDIDGGYVHQLAFVIPGRLGWPLPLYELALMMSARAYEMNVELGVTIATPEGAPVEVFGDTASEAIADLLREREITLITSARCEVPDSRHLVVNPGDRTYAVDRVIALPELYGPAVRGLRADEHGFIPIDEHARVLGCDHVFAAGDATDSPVKYGGVAAHQADRAAAAIARLAGADAAQERAPAVIHGILLTGAAPRYLSAQLADGRGVRSQVTEAPTWSPPVKLAARLLAPYLEAREAAH